MTDSTLIRMANGDQYVATRDNFTYAGVRRRTVDLERLWRLFQIRVDREEATFLVRTLAETFDLTMPKLSFTGRSDGRGTYYHIGQRIVVHHHPRVEILCHELAHHWVETKMVGAPDAIHGCDFIHRADRLSAEAESIVTQLGW